MRRAGSHSECHIAVWVVAVLIISKRGPSSEVKCKENDEDRMETSRQNHLQGDMARAP